METARAADCQRKRVIHLQEVEVRRLTIVFERTAQRWAFENACQTEVSLQAVQFPLYVLQLANF